MLVRDFMGLIDELAPFETALHDNVGLLVGGLDMPVTGVMIALDVTQAVIHQMRERGANLLITHHPLMYAPTHSIRTDTYEGRLITSLITCGYAFICAHTNLDQAPSGVNDVLAGTLMLKSISGEGLYRMGRLEPSCEAHEARKAFEKVLAAPVRLYGDAHKRISTVLASAGAGSEFWEEALRQEADAFLTGEMKHHDILGAVGQGLAVFEAGHFATENPAMDALALALQMRLDALKLNVTVCRPSVKSFPIL